MQPKSSSFTNSEDFLANFFKKKKKRKYSNNRHVTNTPCYKKWDIRDCYLSFYDNRGSVAVFYIFVAAQLLIFLSVFDLLGYGILLFISGDEIRDGFIVLKGFVLCFIIKTFLHNELDRDYDIYDGQQKTVEQIRRHIIKEGNFN